MSTRTIETPIGHLTLQADETAVTAIRFGAGVAQDASPLLDAAEAQLREYFAGTRRTFDLPLAPRGTAFQQRVWAALRAIPYGETRTYGELAAAIGSPNASRAVGMANHRNPIPIIIPLPPRHRCERHAHRLCRWAGGQAEAAGARGDHHFKIKYPRRAAEPMRRDRGTIDRDEEHAGRHSRGRRSGADHSVSRHQPLRR